MARAKHSNGPWEVADNGLTVLGASRTQVVADLSDTNHSANYHPSPKQTQANARLIAAAPELLDALQRAVKVARWCYANHNDIQKGDGIPEFLFWEELIARATGELQHKAAA